MITHRQLRAARALLGWTQQELADRAQLSISTLNRLESGQDMEKRGSSYFRVLRSLEEAGIEFSTRDEGLRLVPARGTGKT
jgi:transcriptional regulator with XRE-family HTH domain